MSISGQHVVARRPGSFGVLRLVPFDVPPPARGEVRIAVRAAGVNYADAIARMGLYEPAWRYVGWPLTPGFEVAGEVETIGEGVTDLRVGDRVLAVTRFGGYASHLVAPRERVFGIPRVLSFEEAAGLPAVFLTAWWALFELAHVEKGQRILVHSAAGGVGGAILQLAKDAGVECVGVVGSAAKVDATRALGAANVLIRDRSLWKKARELAPRGYDVVLDATGPETLKQSYEHLASPGKLIVYGFHSMMKKSGGRPSPFKLAAGWLKTPRFDPLRRPPREDRRGPHPRAADDDLPARARG
jgi:synaptic vesicle membrane protein VAT-1